MDSDREQHTASASSARYRFYISVAAAYLAMMSAGLMCAYSSPALPDIRQRINFTEAEVAWFGSLVLPGAAVGGIVAGQLVNLIGRRGAMISGAAWFVSGWLCIIFAPSTTLLFVGRFLTGGGMGTAAPTTSVFLSEVSPAHLRGLLNTGCNFLMSVGILAGYVLGKWLSYKWLAVACLVPACVMGAAFSFYVRESPRWLLQKGRRRQAAEALEFYMGSEGDKELASLEKTAANAPALSLADLGNPQIYRPFLCSLLPMFMQQTAAINVLLFFAHDIFEDAGTSLAPDNCAIIVGCIITLTFLVATLLADRAGRKVLFIISSVITVLGLALLGLYFHLKEAGGEQFLANYGWFPLAAVGVYFVGHSLGLGPLPFVFLGELIPLKAKGFASAVCTAFLFSVGFLVVKEHFDLQRALGTAGTYWLYGAIVAATFVLFVLFVPETKGKSLEEIERLFASGGSHSHPNISLHATVDDEKQCTMSDFASKSRFEDCKC